MTMEEYLGRYRLIQHSIEKDERSLVLLTGKSYQAFLRCFFETDNPILKKALKSEGTLREALARKRRLAERYATRITRAISHIPTQELREYALYHYLYGLTNEEIAEQSFFCVRTVYRYARKAREQLRLALRAVGPKAVRCAPCRYYPVGQIPRKKTDPDRITRSVAFCTALRRREPYRNVSLMA